MSKIYPVIMCGGSGTRLWPLSRKEAPKQYHSLVSEHSMLQETILRVKSASGLEIAPPSFVCALQHKGLVREQCSSLGIDPLYIISEPIGRNTAPVAALVARLLHTDDPDGLILLLPSDHHVENPEGFWENVSAAVDSAKNGYLMTLGIKPTHAETGYGYIQTGDAISNNVHIAQAFKEKPNLATANEYLKSGDYFWNAGIFLFSSEAMISTFEQLADDILTSVTDVLGKSKIDGNEIDLDEASFSTCRSESIDYAIMEQAEKVAVVAPVDIGWNDMGSWNSLRKMSNELSLAQSGNIISIDCSNNYLRTEGPMIAAIGLENMVVVATNDAILIAPAERSEDVKKIVDELKSKQSGLL